MSDFTNLFIPPSKQVQKTTMFLSKEDYDLIKSIYPEHGFIGYCPALFFSAIAEKLKQENIKTYEDRINHPKLAASTAILSHLGYTVKKSVRNDAGGAGSPHNPAEKRLELNQLAKDTA